MKLAALRETVAYQPLLLGCFALLASAALAVGASVTGAAIAAAEAKDLRDSLSEVLPAGFADNDLLTDTLQIDRDGRALTIHLARRKGKVAAAVFRVTECGYAADIQLLMAVDAQGRTLGVRVVKHAETPGLGDKIERSKSAWIEDFNGKSLASPPPDRWAVGKDGGAFDQFAGATITPRAVVKAVKGGLEFFAAHRRQIIGDQS